MHQTWQPPPPSHPMTSAAGPQASKHPNPARRRRPHDQAQRHADDRERLRRSPTGPAAAHRGPTSRTLAPLINGFVNADNLYYVKLTMPSCRLCELGTSPATSAIERSHPSDKKKPRFSEIRRRQGGSGRGWTRPGWVRLPACGQQENHQRVARIRRGRRCRAQ